MTQALSHVAKLGVDSLEWNFLPFRPGLVGKHCISMDDPYYLKHKAQEGAPGCDPGGRRTNDGIGAYVANEVIRLMVRNGINPVRADPGDGAGVQGEL